ncbi:MAG TPA: gamma-glutamyltransferase family protein [Moraxellaceae bacterium]|nr:gamma-glutamyltransferase family protein [Moraxellaceae bacterium]
MQRWFPLALLLAIALQGALAAPAGASSPSVSIAPVTPEGDTGRYPLSSARAQHALVVTANPHATDAALAIMRRGGSAIDAAIAAQAVLGLVEPQSSGFGGGLFLVLRDGKQVMSYDGRETAPASARPDRFLDKQGQPLAFHAAVGSGRAVGVPGVVAALAAAHRASGRLPWRTLFTPAITLARQGFLVSPRLHALLERDALLREHPASRTYFYDQDGNAWPVGHRLRNPDYAHTLLWLARKGPTAFYRGPEAQALIRILREGGSDLAPSDWSAYRARVSPALCAPYRQWNVCTAPPPSGGWTVLQTLRILDGFPYTGDLPLHLHHLLEAERLSFADRQRYSADPSQIPVPLTGLLDDGYLATRRAMISEQSMNTAPAGVPPGLAPPWGDDGQLREHGTTHLVIADPQGQWVSMTSSIEDAFGSRLMAGGMLFNNQLTDFSFLPTENGHPLANAVAPGKRPRSAMSPVIVLDAAGQPRLAVGSPGGSRIIGYVLRALVASLDQGLSPGATVATPLILSRNGPTEIDQDLPASLRDSLAIHGQHFQPGDLNSGLAVIAREADTLEGAADPRREGKASGF